VRLFGAWPRQYVQYSPAPALQGDYRKANSEGYESLLSELPLAVHVPVSLRPNKMSITDLQLLQDDPYAFYARKILKLFPNKPPNSAIDYGRWAHDLLDRYFRFGYGNESACSFASRTCKRQGLPFQFFLRFIPVLEKIDADLMTNTVKKIFTELRLSATLQIDGRKFEIFGILDRVDFYDDHVKIIDYKTGSLPTEESITALRILQLPVEAMLFKARSPEYHVDLSAVQLKLEFGQQRIVNVSFDDCLEMLVNTHITELLRRYMEEDFVFTSAEIAKDYQYAHLARCLR
jgi:hypothetical protein